MARPLLTALRLTAIAATLAACAACDTPTDPDDPYAGRWRGTITDAAHGPGTIEMTLTPDDPTRYRGSWRMTFASKAIEGSLEFLPDIIADSIFFMCARVPLPPEDGPGPLTMLDIDFNGSRASGSLRLPKGSHGCDGTRGGPVSLTRQ